tara:strand:- start:22 stop:156 length:135 start_codon:yes stop_codon:yes gene_type:complete
MQNSGINKKIVDQRLTLEKQRKELEQQHKKIMEFMNGRRKYSNI